MNAIMPISRETLSALLKKAYDSLGELSLADDHRPMVFTLAKHLGIPFVQEVIAVSTALQGLCSRRQM